MMIEHRPASMSSGMVLLFSVVGATAVGNLYWAQPLLVNAAALVHISVAAAGTLMTATQLGYAPASCCLCLG